jgi:cytochrome c-type biogenesis protein CcmH/NrfG
VSNTRKKIIICIFLIVATFCIYAQVQGHKFINFDDDLYITDNLNVQAGLTSESFKWAFTTSYPPYWHPVTWLSHMLDYQLYNSHPKGHYLTNLFLHISSVLILFIVLFRMTGALWQSGFVAAMFAFHPLNVESVAWIAERKNVLSTLFWLMTMWAYIHYTENPTIKRYGLVFLFFTLGLMSKPMLVTLPFVLLLLDYWPLRRLKFVQESSRNEILEKTTAKKSEVLWLILEKVPLFLLTIGLSIVTVHLQKITGAVNAMDMFSLQTRVTNAVVSYLEYLGKMVWPSGLSILYPHPGNTLPLWQGILCGMALVGITIISIRLIKKAPYFAVGWFWYLGTLVPVIGIVQVGAQAMADRFTYIPLIGIFIIVAWGVPELISKWRHKEKVLSVSAGIIIFTLLITTWKQASHWKNSITVFKHAIRVTDKKYPTLSRIHNNLGIVLYAEGKKQEAISHYKMAIKTNSAHAKAYYNLGIALTAERKNEEAISWYKKAIRLNPNFTNAHYNLGIILLQIGVLQEAVYHFRETVRLRPDLVEAGDYLKYALLQSQELE